MSIHVPRTFSAPGAMLFVVSCLAILDGCSKAGEESAAAAGPNPTVQAQAAQSSIASAQSAHDHGTPAMAQGEGVAAPSASMAMAAPGADGPPMNMGAPAGYAPTGMARTLGQPPMPSSASAAGGLPPAMGAPHLYHLGADTFFLDQVNAVGLTSEQQKKLKALKENATVAYATTQRKVDQGEQDLWVLSSSEAPDVAKIEAKLGEIARFNTQQRMDFIRAVGEAVSVMSDAQRKAVVPQSGPMMQPAAMPPASSASEMSMGSSAPSSGGTGMGMGGSKKMPPGMGTGGGMPPAGMPPGGKGPM